MLHTLISTYMRVQTRINERTERIYASIVQCTQLTQVQKGHFKVIYSEYVYEKWISD